MVGPTEGAGNKVIVWISRHQNSLLLYLRPLSSTPDLAGRVFIYKCVKKEFLFLKSVRKLGQLDGTDIENIAFLDRTALAKIKRS